MPSNKERTSERSAKSNKSDPKSGRPTLEHQEHSKDLNESLLKLYSDARGNALPLTRAANQNEFMKFFRWGDPDHDSSRAQIAKVSLSTLLSYSTPKERAWMVLGIFMVCLLLSLLCIFIWQGVTLCSQNYCTSLHCQTITLTFTTGYPCWTWYTHLAYSSSEIPRHIFKHCGLAREIW